MVEKFSYHLETIMHDVFRPIALVASLMAFFLLVESTIHGEDKVNILFQLASWSTLVPFGLFSTYSVVRATMVTQKIAKETKSIDDNLLQFAAR